MLANILLPSAARCICLFRFLTISFIASAIAIVIPIICSSAVKGPFSSSNNFLLTYLIINFLLIKNSQSQNDRSLYHRLIQSKMTCSLKNSTFLFIFSRGIECSHLEIKLNLKTLIHRIRFFLEFIMKYMPLVSFEQRMHEGPSLT